MEISWRRSPPKRSSDAGGGNVASPACSSLSRTSSVMLAASSAKRSISPNSLGSPAPAMSSCRTITPVRLGTSYADCTIRSSRRRANWCRPIVGRIFDVAVDLRRSSTSFGRHVAVELSARNRRSLWIPAGFAHGFAALDPWNEVLYKTTQYYAPRHERSLLWNDPQLSIDWPISPSVAITTPKDASAPPLTQAETYE